MINKITLLAIAAFLVFVALALPFSLIDSVRSTHAKSVCMSNGYARLESTGFVWSTFYCVKRVEQTDVVVPESSL